LAGYQIIGVRSYFDEKERKQKRFDAFYEMRWRFDTLSEIFTDPIAVLDRNRVPAEERFNLFYTISLCGDGKRQGIKVEQLAFDVDGINVDRVEEYVDPILKIISRPDATVVFSGNGLHFLFPITNVITPEEHEGLRGQYKGILNRINVELERLRLPGKADPAIWDLARILRIPETLNLKPDKKNPDQLIERRCFVLRQGSHKALPFDWDKVSGQPKLDSSQALTEGELRRFTRKNPGDAALEQCLFLKNVKENPVDQDEPELYAALSIIGRFENGKALATEIFSPRFGRRTHGGSAADIEEKIDQAVTASGPRTCANINRLWGKCSGCPLFEKVKSPVMIFGQDVIPTEATGFYDVIPVEGKAPKLVPNYGDLLKAFKRDHSYFTNSKTERAICFDKTHWRSYGDLELSGYAEAMFVPAPKQAYRSEFTAKVLSNNQRDEKAVERFLRSTTKGKLNLANGVLDVATGELSEHSSEYGFTYCLPYGFDSTAKAPTFERFLAEVTCGNKSFAASLLDFLAYLLVPDYEDHCFLWLEGTGRNGKSTFMEVLQWLVGEDSTSAVMLDQFEEPNMVETMNHKLLNISEESDNRRIGGKTLGILKALSAGGSVQVHQKYELPYNMRPTAKLVFASNIRPKLDGAGQALASRMILVPFHMQLEDYRGAEASKVDKGLKAKLQAEMPGILNLALERLRAQSGRPFHVHRADESAEEVRQLLVESDPMESWLEDECQVLAEARTPTAHLYGSYKDYMQQHHPKEYCQAIRQFSSNLRGKLRGRVERCEIGHAKVAGLRGLALKTTRSSDF
jgi:P4 family phage/plasmid primase-like protien